MRKKGIWVAVAATVGVGIGIAVQVRRPAPTVPTTRPTPAATPPATRPARPKRPVYATYMDAVRAANPAVAATQPLGVPVDLPDAAHVILHGPVYVDPAGNLWVTRADAPPTDKLLADPGDGPEFVTRERPVFVHWETRDDGAWRPVLVVAVPGGFDQLTAAGRRHLAGPRPFRWAAAYSVPALGKFVVPTDAGVSVFDADGTEHYHPLPGCGPTTAPPVTLPDTRGVLAWAPWDGARPGSAGISRFVDGGWVDLPAAEWPAKPVLLSMLLDGSVLRVAAGGPPVDAPDPDALDAAATTQPAAVPAGPPDRVTLSIGQLDPVTLDAPHVDGLIAKLSDPDPDQRRAAFDELARYGTGLWPVLERAAPLQPPEGQARIAQLLRGKLAPALGGMALLEDRLTVAGRQDDGTTILYAPAGVRLARDVVGGGQDIDETVVPAWLAVRADGRVDRPLPPALVADQLPDACTLHTVSDEWLVIDPAGPRRFIGNALVPMLPRPERHFTRLVALAARHRWVFRDPTTGDTLVVDPTIADPTPRLPTWTITPPGGTVGWDDAGDPVVQRGEPLGGGGGNPAGAPAPAGPAGRFALGPEGWRALAPSDVMHVDPAPAPPVELPTTAPTTGPTTGPATTPADGPLLLRADDGTRYYDGRSAIVTVDKGGHRASWPLPPAAVGSSATDPVLLRTDDGLLFLFNAAGRLLRLRRDADGTFHLEATFTDGIPNDDRPTRVWLDPAGRIDFATGGNVLTITFPAGRLPKAIADMMPAATEH
jgi:hypothetical protein